MLKNSKIKSTEGCWCLGLTSCSERQFVCLLLSDPHTSSSTVIILRAVEGRAPWNRFATLSPQSCYRCTLTRVSRLWWIHYVVRCWWLAWLSRLASVPFRRTAYGQFAVFSTKHGGRSVKWLSTGCAPEVWFLTGADTLLRVPVSAEVLWLPVIFISWGPSVRLHGSTSEIRIASGIPILSLVPHPGVVSCSCDFAWSVMADILLHVIWTSTK